MDSSDSNHGYNPMRWDCEKQGCFNLKCRPKIEIFCDCFPGKINFGDVDGLVEINGKGLLLEWKHYANAELKKGQLLAYERLTRGGMLSVLVVAGNAETMEVISYQLFYDGRGRKKKTSNLEGLKQRIKKWTKWANRKI